MILQLHVIFQLLLLVVIVIGERTPAFDSDKFNSIVDGICILASKKNLDNISKEIVINDFKTVFGNNAAPFSVLRDNFNELISTLDINISKLAKAIGFDSSYISRISSGERKPSDVESFIDSVCQYVVKYYSEDSLKETVRKLIKCHKDALSNNDNYLVVLKNWMYQDHNYSEDSISNFLEKLDKFNLDEFIKVIHFDDIKIPTMTFHFTTSKNYYGIASMKNGELDFLKSTIVSKPTEPIFMYNDMPMQDLAKDMEFSKKWMYAIACTVKKGFKINMVHNLNRSFNELLLGLETWLPIYMSGQVTPYYFKDEVSNLFYNTLYVSGSSVLSGDGIKGNHDKAKYYVTNKKEELEYYKEKAKLLLEKASPLMNIYTKENNDAFKEFMKLEKSNKENIIVNLENEDLNKTFKNIQFTVCKNKWVLVSKKTAPKINFVIYHKTVRNAIENFITLVEE